eukprot:166065-Chlamydomonas_euryale.AAC.2
MQLQEAGAAWCVAAHFKHAAWYAAAPTRSMLHGVLPPSPSPPRTPSIFDCKLLPQHCNMYLLFCCAALAAWGLEASSHPLVDSCLAARKLAAQDLACMHVFGKGRLTWQTNEKLSYACRLYTAPR